MNQPSAQAFDRLGNEYKNWKITAQELWASAAVLYREREKAEAGIAGIAGPSKAPIEMLTLWVDLMLRGFAIECLLKALWVRNGNKIAKDGKYQNVTKTEKHDLVDLCQTVGFPAIPSEMAILRKLSKLVRATGRYPIAKRFTDMHEDEKWWSSTEDETLEKFVHRIKWAITNAKVAK